AIVTFIEPPTKPPGRIRDSSAVSLGRGGSDSFRDMRLQRSPGGVASSEDWSVRIFPDRFRGTYIECADSTMCQRRLRAATRCSQSSPEQLRSKCSDCRVCKEGCR